jgi:hypothetical protein
MRCAPNGRMGTDDDRVLTRLSFGTAHRQRSNCHDLSHVGQTLRSGVPALPRTDISRRCRAVACVSRGNLAYREPIALAAYTVCCEPSTKLPYTSALSTGGTGSL